MFEVFQPTHLLFVFLVALAVFGPKRLIEVSRDVGQFIQRIQEYKEEIKEEPTFTPPTEDDDEDEETELSTASTSEKKG